MMNVRELMDALAELPQDAQVKLVETHSEYHDSWSLEDVSVDGPRDSVVYLAHTSEMP